MQKNMHTILPKPFNYTFVNPGFYDFPEILNLQKEGKRIRIVFENDLFRIDFFQVSMLFPFYFSEVFHKKYEWEKFRKAIKTVPHLFLSQKVFYIGNRRKAQFADVLLKNRFQQKMQVLLPEQKKAFDFLNPDFQTGLFFQEYRMNVSRFFIELLHYFAEKGGEVKILEKETFSKELDFGKTIFCSTHTTTIFKASVETFPGFYMQVLWNSKRFCLNENENVLEIQMVGKSENPVEIEEIVQLLEFYFRIKKPAVKIEKIPLQLSFSVLHEIVSLVEPPTPGAFEQAGFENMFELCREKFDIARQTGIDFPEFKLLFHRYGKNIDELIDRAYETMNEVREPSKIWAKTEAAFQKEKEWKN